MLVVIALQDGAVPLASTGPEARESEPPHNIPSNVLYSTLRAPVDITVVLGQMNCD